MQRYLIDANILISLDIFTPREYHLDFWAGLKEQIAKGNIILLDVIYDECKSPHLKKWLDKEIKAAGLITPVSTDIKNKGLALNKKYGIITKDAVGRIKSAADTYLIAYAKKNGLVIFTYESKRRDVQAPMKIPDVCDAQKVPYQRLTRHVMNVLKFRSCTTP